MNKAGYKNAHLIGLYEVRTKYEDETRQFNNLISAAIYFESLEEDRSLFKIGITDELIDYKIY
jgi:hypothetical protein